MQIRKKTNSVMTTRVEGSTLTISVLGAGDIVFNADAASEANNAHARMHGWTQRLCDRAAKGRDATTGLSATPAEKHAAIAELAEYYMSGDVNWKMSGSGVGGDGLLLRALMEYKPGHSREKLVAYLATMAPKVKNQLLNSPAILPIANRLRAEAAGDVDADELLAGMDALDAADEDVPTDTDQAIDG